MPQAITQIEHAAAVVAVEQLVALLEVRHVGELDAQAPVLRLGDVAADRGLDRAEVTAELDLLVVGHRLIVEHQHGIFVHAGFDRSDLLARERLGEVDAGNLAGKAGADLADADGHGVSPVIATIARGLTQPSLRSRRNAVRCVAAASMKDRSAPARTNVTPRLM